MVEGLDLQASRALLKKQIDKFATILNEASYKEVTFLLEQSNFISEHARQLNESAEIAQMLFSHPIVVKHLEDNVAKLHSLLLHAAFNGYVSFAKSLSHLNSFKKALTMNENGVFRVAASNDMLEMVKFLCSYDCVTDNAHAKNNYALTIALEQEYPQIVAFLLGLPAVRQDLRYNNLMVSKKLINSGDTDNLDLAFKSGASLSPLIDNKEMAITVEGFRAEAYKFLRNLEEIRQQSPKKESYDDDRDDWSENEEDSDLECSEEGIPQKQSNLSKSETSKGSLSEEQLYASELLHYASEHPYGRDPVKLIFSELPFMNSALSHSYMEIAKKQIQRNSHTDQDPEDVSKNESFLNKAMFCAYERLNLKDKKTSGEIESSLTLDEMLADVSLDTSTEDESEEVPGNDHTNNSIKPNHMN